MRINILEYKNQDIEIKVTKNEVSWSFELAGKRYGNAAILPSKKVDDIIAITGTIIINAINTYEDLCKQNNSSETSPKN